MKSFRQAIIFGLIEEEAIKSQEQLRQRLRVRKIVTTQATISRDIKELQLVKRSSDGAYQKLDREIRPTAGVETALRRAVGEYLRRVTRVHQLVVLGTDPGQAQLLALAIDRTNISGVVGTIGGDDTILVIAHDPKSAKSLVRRLERWAKR